MLWYVLAGWQKVHPACRNISHQQSLCGYHVNWYATIEFTLSVAFLYIFVTSEFWHKHVLCIVRLSIVLCCMLSLCIKIYTQVRVSIPYYNHEDFTFMAGACSAQTYFLHSKMSADLIDRYCLVTISGHRWCAWKWAHGMFPTLASARLPLTIIAIWIFGPTFYSIAEK